MSSTLLSRSSRITFALALSLLQLTGCIAAQGERPDLSEEAETNEEGLSGSMPVGTVLNTIADLNFRAGPSTASQVLDVLPMGAEVILQAAAPTDGFYQISFKGKVGWSSGKYLQPASGGSVGPATATLVATGDVNLRSGPSTSDTVLTVIPMGSQVTVQQPEPVNGFYNVTYQTLTGWSSGKYLGAGSGPVTPGAPGATTPFANGQLWKLQAKTLAVSVAVFVPAAAAQASEVDVLLYVHGHNVCSPVAKSPPLSFVTDDPFRLAEIVDASGRPIVLVVPFMDWEHLGANQMAWGGSHHKLGMAAKLNGVVAEVLADVGLRTGTAEPALSSLILAGHSRAYDVLNPLAAANADAEMSKGALAKLSHVWGFDSSYSCSPLSAWTGWLASKPSLEVDMFYKSGTGTAACGKQFADLAPQSGGRLTVKVVSESHCAVPATRFPALLEALP